MFFAIEKLKYTPGCLKLFYVAELSGYYFLKCDPKLEKLSMRSTYLHGVRDPVSLRPPAERM